MKSISVYDPLAYWSGLVAGADSSHVEQVGHSDMGRAFNRLAYRLRLRAVSEAMGRSNSMPPASVFEAAFGVGFYLDYWRRLGVDRVAGADLSDRAVENVRRRFPAYDLRVGDLASIHRWSDWACLAASFGVVTAIDVLYHIVDDDAARQAVVNLGRLTAPGGIFLLTEKFPKGAEPVRETLIVRRRSVAWYEATLRDLGFALERVVPAFWCMDPPIFNGGHRRSAIAAYLVWGAMRACIKFWPRAGIQNVFGGMAGRIGWAVDSLVVPRLSETPNLTVAVFRKTPGG